MVLTSLANWCGFIILVAVFWLLPPRWRLGWLACFSLVLLALNDFAAAVLIGYLLLLCLLSPIWIAGIRWRAWAVVAALLIPLAVFKYPILLGLARLQESTALAYDPAALALPLGISYVTFKALMYTLEVSRERIAAPGLTALASYLALAPVVSAGPIDKPQHLLPQLLKEVRPSLDLLIYGGYRIILGIIFKFIVADGLGMLMHAFSPGALAVSTKKLLLFGPIYSLIIYFDFAGYSHIAIGAAAGLGLRCQENFASPYFKPNIGAFWRSWHMSLMKFLRDYIYFPIAYRLAKPAGARTAAHLAGIVTFIACGLWHGDGWNFLAWGLYHGLLLSAHQLFLKATKRAPLFKRLRRQRWLLVPSIALTFALVTLGWYLFAFSPAQLAIIFGGGG